MQSEKGTDKGLNQSKFKENSVEGGDKSINSNEKNAESKENESNDKDSSHSEIEHKDSSLISKITKQKIEDKSIELHSPQKIIEENPMG